MVAAENDALPNGKVGGVGDVIRDVPIELVKQGHQVDVITPGYGFHAKDNPSTLIKDFTIKFSGKKESIQLFKLELEDTKGVSHWVIESELFALYGPGKIYFDDGHKRPFASDATKFAFFCAALAELLVNDWQDNFSVIHLHDWHAATLAILREFEPRYQTLHKTPFVYTIHNLALQGIRPYDEDSSSLTHWFPDLDFKLKDIRDPRYKNCFNPVRAGINLSQAVHVVSPTYATEILKPSDHDNGFIGGEGLEVDLQNAFNEKRLHGILNGCDYDSKPADKMSPETFFKQVESTLKINLTETLSQTKNKPTVKSKTHDLALKQVRDWNNKNFQRPLLTSVGRITSQKVSLLVEPYNSSWVIDAFLEELAEYNGRLIILGSGDGKLESQLTQVMERHENFLFLNGYWQEISDQLYQLGDLFLMPSSFEPCGISQMIAMRFGQPCLVHDIGGLHDTVQHMESGFAFCGSSIEEQSQNLLQVLRLALTTIEEDKSVWSKIKQNALAQQFDWGRSVKQYVGLLYDSAC